MDKSLLDRINIAYKGELGEEMQNRSRERIDWMCANARGEKILDVGCSQGIASIVLGREGKHVTGIDIVAGQIEYAQKELEKEDDFVQKNVEFITGDFVNVSFGEEKFDTIIMGECLEHVFNPTLFLEKAVQLLSDNGRIIVTVPFGINPFPDHKRTYYFLELFNQISERICIESVKFFGKWIGFIAENDLKETNIIINDTLIALIENAFFEVDTNSNEKIKMLSKKANDSLAMIKKLSDELTEKRNVITVLKENEEQLSEAIEYKEKQLVHSNSIIREKIEQIDVLEKKENYLNNILDQNEVLITNNKNVIDKKKRQIALLESKIVQLGFFNDNIKKELDHAQKALECKSKEIEEAKAIQTQLEISTKNFESQIKEANKNNLLLLDKMKGMQELQYNVNNLKNKNKVLIGEKQKIQNELTNFNNQLYRYKLEYSKLINSKSIKLVLAIKKFIGRSYNPQYINGDISLNQENDMFFLEGQEGVRSYKNSNINENFLLSVREDIKLIQDSNGCRYYEKYNKKIGIVCDRFLFDAYKNAADFIYLTPNNWRDEAEKCEILIVATTWHGLQNEWEYLTSKTSDNRKILIEIIKYFKEHNKKTVFYSKEDPVSFDEFLYIAKECKYIFTSDLDCVQKYKEACNNENVKCLTFCIDPIYHNPIGMRCDKNKVIFSGSWMERFPQRCSDQEYIFNGIINSKKDFVIVDRNYNLNNSRYVFPYKYHQYIVPSIDHDELQKVHKLYNWAINLNSIKASSTMFANRAYELQAEGNLIISNYSMGMFNLLPYIFIAHSKKDVELILNSLSENEIYERKIFGVRYVMSENTCFDRLGELLNGIGIKVEATKRTVCVVADTITPDVKEMFENQTYEEKQLISMDQYNEEVHKKFDIIAFFKHDMEYSMFYLEDMINAFKYTSCSYITKDTYYSGRKLKKGKENAYISNIGDKYRTIFWANEFDFQDIKNHSFSNKNNGYCIDRFNYNKKKYVSRVERAGKYKLSVIVPTYNNGDFLYGKAFASLKRSELFDDIEIIIVDDGSTDGYTINLIKYLANQYTNVKTYFFNDGGSGSASRPRNMGVKISSTNLIAFIDPDNEIIGDSYEKMYKKIANNEELDFISGNMLIMRGDCQKWNFYSSIVNRQDYCNVLENNRYAILKGCADILEHCNFTGIQMQAALIKKDFLINNKLVQVEGAAGEDTLFGWQWVTKAKYFGMLNEEMSIYYAGRNDSIVNQISAKFFERYYKIEKPRREFLEKEDLLNVYMKNRFNSYFKGWTLQHLIMAEDKICEKAAKCVEDIFNIYKDVYWENDEIINAFIELCNNGKYKKAVLYLKENMK